MIPIQFLNETNTSRTYNPFDDSYNHYVTLRIPGIHNPKLEAVIIEADKLRQQPFLRFFYYGTNIGETLEEVIGRKFDIDIVPKLIKERTKNGKGFKKNLQVNPVYKEYYKTHGMTSTNFDWLFRKGGNLLKLEVKVIRAAEGKEKLTSEKLYQIQTPLVERALTYNQGSGGNGTFQQTKPEFFDYVMGIVIYSDRVDFYLVPSADINREENIINGVVEIDEETGKKKKGIGGKLILKPQHGKAQKNSDGTYKEGHLVLDQLNDPKDGYLKLSVYTEEELLSKDTLNKYIV